MQIGHELLQACIAGVVPKGSVSTTRLLMLSAKCESDADPLFVASYALAFPRSVDLPNAHTGHSPPLREITYRGVIPHPLVMR